MESRIPRAHQRVQSEKIKMLYVHLISNFMLLVDDIPIQREGVLMMEWRSTGFWLEVNKKNMLWTGVLIDFCAKLNDRSFSRN